ncbi:MAG: hypothetical protein RJQ07_15080 [Pseudomonadales bacterium]
MLELIAPKCSRGDLYVNLAKKYLQQHQWGRAREAVQRCIDKGNLLCEAEVQKLLNTILSKIES